MKGDIYNGKKRWIFRNAWKYGKFDETGTEDAASDGSTVWVDNSAPEKVFSFSREYGGKKIVFIGNISCEKAAFRFNTEPGDRALFTNGAEKISDGTIELEPRGYIVLEK